MIEISPGEAIPYDAYYTSKNVEKHLYAQAKSRAKKAGLEFTIELSDIVIPVCCPYLGVELTRTYGKGRLQTNALLDRIDSKKGYIKGNVQVISLLANQMKTNATLEQVIAFSFGAIQHHEELASRLIGNVS